MTLGHHGQINGQAYGRINGQVPVVVPAQRRPLAVPVRVTIAPGMVFDLIRHDVLTAGRRTHLTQTEALLLAHLVRCENQVCTRAELLSDVWGLSHDPGTNMLEAAIARLRAKLPEDSIITERNIGYRWER